MVYHWLLCVSLQCIHFSEQIVCVLCLGMLRPVHVRPQCVRLDILKILIIMLMSFSYLPGACWHCRQWGRWGQGSSSSSSSSGSWSSWGGRIGWKIRSCRRRPGLFHPTASRGGLQRWEKDHKSVQLQRACLADLQQPLQGTQRSCRQSHHSHHVCRRSYSGTPD